MALRDGQTGQHEPRGRRKRETDTAADQAILPEKTATSKIRAFSERLDPEPDLTGVVRDCRDVGQVVGRRERERHVKKILAVVVCLIDQAVVIGRSGGVDRQEGGGASAPETGKRPEGNWVDGQLSASKMTERQGEKLKEPVEVRDFYQLGVIRLQTISLISRSTQSQIPAHLKRIA